MTIDEMRALTDVRLRESRKQNHARILALLNAVHQGGLERIGFVFAGTEDFVTDPRRGLYSEKGLATRLTENRFAEGDLVDYEHPILRLANLTREEMYVLLTRIRSVAEKDRAVPDEAIRAFMKHCSEHIGDGYFRTPRATITAFANLLATLDQNPGANWEGLLRAQPIARDDGDSRGTERRRAGGEPDGAGRTDSARSEAGQAAGMLPRVKTTDKQAAAAAAGTARSAGTDAGTHLPGDRAPARTRSTRLRYAFSPRLRGRWRRSTR